MRSRLVMTAVMLAVLPAAAAATVTAGNTGWRWGNPLPQGNGLAVLDVVGSRAYAGGESGTLLRSDDAGSTWSTVRTGMLDDVKRVRAIGADSVVFAGRCALRRSDDGGQTVTRLPWTPSDESCSPEIKSFHFPSSGVGYLLLDNGDFLWSPDAGASWTKRAPLPTSPSAGGGSPVGDIWFTGDTTGVATVDNRIYRTTDAGQSWNLVDDVAPAALTAFTFVNANSGLAVGKGKFALATSDGGVTWTPVTINAGAAGVDLGAVDCFNPNRCAAAAVDGSQVFTTEDGGAAWQSVATSANGAVAVGYASASRIAGVGAEGTIVTSDDGGATWQTVSTDIGGSYTGVRAVSASTAYAFGENGAIARTVDGGATWIRLGAPVNSRIAGVAFPTAARGFALDANGAVSRTDDGGGTWQPLAAATRLRARAISAPAKNIVVLVGRKGVHRSTNGGGRFRAAKGRRLSSLRLIRLDHAGRVLFAYGTDTIVRSTDRGRSWRPIAKPRKARRTVQIDMVTASSGYLLDARGELWLTRTAGRKWLRIQTTGSTYTDSIAFGNLRNGYLADETGRILRTADGGRTWSRQYPFYFPAGGARIEMEAPAARTAFMALGYTQNLFSTTTGGTIGVAGKLTLKTSSRKVRRGATVKLSGRLSPAAGGERISVVARPLDASGGTAWRALEAVVAADGSFATNWKVRKTTIFIARWSGDAAHDGSAARSVVVKVR